MRKPERKLRNGKPIYWNIDESVVDFLLHWQEWEWSLSWSYNGEQITPEEGQMIIYMFRPSLNLFVGEYYGPSGDSSVGGVSSHCGFCTWHDVALWTSLKEGQFIEEERNEQV